MKLMEGREIPTSQNLLFNMQLKGKKGMKIYSHFYYKIFYHLPSITVYR